MLVSRSRHIPSIMIEMSDSNRFGLGHSDKSLICRPIVLPNLFDKVVVVVVIFLVTHLKRVSIKLIMFGRSLGHIQ